MSVKADKALPLLALRRKGVVLAVRPDFPEEGWRGGRAISQRAPEDCSFLIEQSDEESVPGEAPGQSPETSSLSYSPLLYAGGCLHVEAGRDYWLYCEKGGLPTAALTEVATSVTVLGRHGRDGRLNFGHRVGRTTFAGLPVEVHERRLGAGAFEAMLRDVTEAASGLLFDCEGPSGVGLSKRRVRQKEALYPLFRFLRYAMREAPPDERLGSCFGEIVRSPHHRTFRRREWAPVHGGRDVLPVTLLGLSCRPEFLTLLPEASPLRESAVGRRLGRFGKPFFPERILTERILTTFDTQENRFVKHFMGLIQDILETVAGAFRHEKDAISPANCRDAIQLLGEVRRFRRADFLKEVAPLNRMPGESQVLRKRAGYRELTRLYHLLFLASQTGWDDLVHIENWRLDVLYEYWCFFRVLTILRGLYGLRRPVKVGSLEPVRSGLLLDLSREGTLTVTFSGVAGRLQRGAVTFSRPYRAGRGSYSVDYAANLTVQAASGRTLAIRVGYDHPGSEDVEDVEGVGAALAPLHALRDATPCTAAVLLAPLARSRFYPAQGAFSGFEKIGRKDLDGVGVLALSPASPSDAVRLARVLEAFLAA